MYRALYGGGFQPRFYQPPREINPEYKPTPKPVVKTVRVVREIFYPDRYTNMVSRRVLTDTWATLADERGEPICFEDVEEAQRAADRCRKMISLFERTR